MAIAPSNNLLSALSQLQSGRPAAAPKPAAAPAGTPDAPKVGAAPGSFAAQLAAPVNAIRTSVAERPAFAAPAQPANQPPIPARGGYLGQYVNIVV
ncbi:MAG TPA: hypothetical protein VKZ87_13915 [Ferrovibrio sp.]|jgi:hypothetical protein|uniref:hypothetical protein n=1 Tax=Ferrovibrio sp. TaxID=1917215 RepID=UPI002B4B38A7|nr:hypothetical protein [Ferrovibrio sp.]HLT78476.1 hypothetical protein [Ferrovibrio sp.]